MTLRWLEAENGNASEDVRAVSYLSVVQDLRDVARDIKHVFLGVVVTYL